MAPAPTTIDSDILIGFAETMTNQLETRRVEEVTPEEASSFIPFCEFFEKQFAQTRRSLVERLIRGVEGRAFAAKFEDRVASLEAVLARMNRVVTKVRTGPLSSPVEEFLSSFRALMDEMLRLHQVLSQAVAKAKMPLRPVDWNRVREADEAYARGETKPFQRSPKS
jgi:hypothetical protein